METALTLEYGHSEPLPPGFSNEVRTPDHLVELFLREHTDPGDAVFDPFAGFGTTLAVAERLDRESYGLEFEADRVAAIRDRLADPSGVRRGDVLALDPESVPPCDCCFTSPPFMTERMERNPFRNYAGESTYTNYLDDVREAFDRVAAILKPGSTLVVDVANMRTEAGVTTLAWDVADAVAAVDSLTFDGEVVVTWTREAGDDEDRGGGTYGYGYDHTYCLVFERNG